MTKHFFNSSHFSKSFGDDFEAALDSSRSEIDEMCFPSDRMPEMCTFPEWGRTKVEKFATPSEYANLATLALQNVSKTTSKRLKNDFTSDSIFFLR